jgi:hypothetical protein
MSTPSVIKTKVSNDPAIVSDKISELESQRLTIIAQEQIDENTIQIVAKNMKAANRPGLELTN